MQNRDDVDGSQRPRTADAPDLKPATEGRLGRGGDPVEGRDPDAPAGKARETGRAEVSDHLGPAGDPVEGADPSGVGVENTPAKE